MEEKQKIRAVMKFFSIVVCVMIIFHLMLVLRDFFFSFFTIPAPVVEYETMPMHTIRAQMLAGHINYHLYLIMHTLILLELLYLTLTYFYLDEINPTVLILTVLTAVGREIVATDPFKEEPLNLAVVALIFFICIYGIKVLSKIKMDDENLQK